MEEKPKRRRGRPKKKTVSKKKELVKNIDFSEETTLKDKNETSFEVIKLDDKEEVKVENHVEVPVYLEDLRVFPLCDHQSHHLWLPVRFPD